MLSNSPVKGSLHVKDNRPGEFDVSHAKFKGSEVGRVQKLKSPLVSPSAIKVPSESVRK